MYFFSLEIKVMSFLYIKFEPELILILIVFLVVILLIVILDKISKLVNCDVIPLHSLLRPRHRPRPRLPLHPHLPPPS